MPNFDVISTNLIFRADGGMPFGFDSFGCPADPAPATRGTASKSGQTNDFFGNETMNINTIAARKH